MARILMRKNALAVALLSAGFCMGALAQATAGTSTATSSASAPSASTKSTAGASTKAALDHGDRKFLETATMGGMAEVELGKLAQQKAANEQVKKFGERMAEDHGKANDKLKQLASAKGVQVPSSLDKKNQAEVDRLQKLSGADFDRAYMKHMVSDHKKDVAEFRKEAKSAKDSEVKSFASDALPTLEEHLKLAQSTEDAVKHEKKTAGTTPSGTTSTSGTAASGAAAKKP